MIDLAPAAPSPPGEDVQAPVMPFEQVGWSAPLASERPNEARRRQAEAASKLAGTPAVDETSVADKEVAWLIEAAASLGVDTDTYERYAVKRWGQGWKKAAGGRKRALDDMTPFLDDAAGFVEKVDGELDAWA